MLTSVGLSRRERASRVVTHGKQLYAVAMNIAFVEECQLCPCHNDGRCMLNFDKDSGEALSEELARQVDEDTYRGAKGVPALCPLRGAGVLLRVGEADSNSGGG
jgi:hypothetical protein